MHRIVPAPRTVLLLVLALAWCAPSAGATLRVPQVAVQGGTLQGALNGFGENINVLTDQNALQLFRATVSSNSSFTVQLEVLSHAAGDLIGLYDADAVAPELMPIFPAEADAGWFAAISFRTNPTRVMVNVFDQNVAVRALHTYPGGNKNAFAFYVQGAGATFYMQDARNPGGDPQALTFPGTGINSGSWWLAFEDAPFAGGSDRDFDDDLLFLESTSCFTDCTPVVRSTWGQVKAYYR
jgi:hypothetical protein